MATYKTLLPVALLTVLCVLALSLYNKVQAQNTASLSVQFSKTAYRKGDTISIEASLADYKTIAKAASLQLLVENVKTGKKWKFRYPLINGFIHAKLAIDSSMEDGLYVFNFLLQKNFFSLTGQVPNAGKKDKLLNYAMIAKAGKA